MREHENDPPRRHSNALREEDNRRILLLTGLSVAVALVLASLYPPPLLLAAFSGLLLLMAFATALTAALLIRRPLENHLTLWDKAALLAFVGLAAGMLVDAEAVRTFVEMQAPSGAAGEVGVPVGEAG